MLPYSEDDVIIEVPVEQEITPEGGILYKYKQEGLSDVKRMMIGMSDDSSIAYFKIEDEADVKKLVSLGAKKLSIAKIKAMVKANEKQLKQKADKSKKEE